MAAIDAARHNVIRKARTAAVELNHLTDFVLYHQTPPMAFADLAAIRTAIRSVCMFARGPVTVQDTDLLRDAADALKHAVLGRQESAIAVAPAIVSISNGWGALPGAEARRQGAGHRADQGRQQIFAALDRPQHLRRVDDGARAAADTAR